MTEPPCRAQTCSGAGGAAAGVGDERRDRNQMVRVGRVTQPEREREQQDDERAVARRVAADEAVDASHWTIH